MWRESAASFSGSSLNSPPEKISTPPSAMRSPDRSVPGARDPTCFPTDRKSTRLNSSHLVISYAVFCLKKKKQKQKNDEPKNAQHTRLVRTHSDSRCRRIPPHWRVAVTLSHLLQVLVFFFFFFLMIRRPPSSTLFPYPTLFR